MSNRLPGIGSVDAGEQLSIRLIDISNCRQQDSRSTADTARELAAACHDIGFVYVAGHGIPAKTFTRIRAAVIAWFDQPGSVKERSRISRDNYRGYIPAGFQRAAVHVGDVSREIWRTNWPDTAPANSHFELGTLED